MHAAEKKKRVGNPIDGEMDQKRKNRRGTWILHNNAARVGLLGLFVKHLGLAAEIL